MAKCVVKYNKAPSNIGFFHTKIGLYVIGIIDCNRMKYLKHQTNTVFTMVLLYGCKGGIMPDPKLLTNYTQSSSHGWGWSFLHPSWPIKGWGFLGDIGNKIKNTLGGTVFASCEYVSSPPYVYTPNVWGCSSVTFLNQTPTFDLACG